MLRSRRVASSLVDPATAVANVIKMLSWVLVHWVEVLGFVTGAACVLLAARRNVWTYPIGIANNVVFAVLFIVNGLYAAVGLQVVFLVLGAHGWYRWTHGLEQDRSYVAHTPRAAIAPLAGAAVGVTLALAWVLATFTDSTVVVADAATTAVSLVAQYMLNRKWIETWFVWIVADIGFVILYVWTGLWITAALYLVFIGLCVAGFVSWRRVERNARALV